MKLKGKKRLRLLLLLICVLLIANVAFAYRSLLLFRYYMLVMWQMPSFAGAAYVYHKQYDSLPEDIRVMEVMGLFGRSTYRLPQKGTWKWNDNSGPYVLYLPISNWDKKTSYVIAVNPPVQGTTRTYIIIGDTTVKRATEEDLSDILSRDDKLREKNHQKGRWKDIPWQAAVSHP